MGRDTGADSSRCISSNHHEEAMETYGVHEFSRSCTGLDWDLTCLRFRNGKTKVVPITLGHVEKMTECWRKGTKISRDLKEVFSARQS